MPDRKSCTYVSGGDDTWSMTLDRADLAPPLLVPSGSAFNPMVLDRPTLLPVLDTNALLVEACSLAKHGRRQDRVTALASTGRATPL